MELGLLEADDDLIFGDGIFLLWTYYLLQLQLLLCIEIDLLLGQHLKPQKSVGNLKVEWVGNVGVGINLRRKTNHKLSDSHF